MGTFGGILKWLLGTLLVVAVGTFIINRIAPVKAIIYGA